MSELVRRQAATQATLDAFKGKPFRYGTRDCVRLVAFHLRQFGYQVRLPSEGSYRTEKSAAAALAKRGFADLGAAIDALGLKSIPPAATLPGDIIMLPGEGLLGGALTIAVGNGRVLGYHEDATGAIILQPVELGRAWRAISR